MKNPTPVAMGGHIIFGATNKPNAINIMPNTIMLPATMFDFLWFIVFLIKIKKSFCDWYCFQMCSEDT